MSQRTVLHLIPYLPIDWRTYFGGGVGQAIEGGGFPGAGLAHQSDERIARHFSVSAD